MAPATGRREERLSTRGAGSASNEPMTLSRTSRAIGATRRGWLSPALVCAALACVTKPQQPPPAPERTGYVAQPCAGLELGAEPLDPADARVFVEVAELSQREPPGGRPLHDSVVKVRSSVNLVAFPGVPTSMPWGQCVDAVCAGAQRTITLTATLPALASEPLPLTLRIDEAPDGVSDSPTKTLLDTTLSATNQQPVVLPPAPAVSDGSLVVTAYLLRRHDDLHRVLECKVQQAEREKSIAP
jgi:hypothetical protein